MRSSVQLTHRFAQNYSALWRNYTWAHAMDYNPYLSTNAGTNQQLDPNDLTQEYGNSILNVRQSRFVFSGNAMSATSTAGQPACVRQAGQRMAHQHGIFQSQTGLPFSANTLTRQPLPARTYSGIIGAGGINRLPKYDANRNLLVERNS